MNTFALTPRHARLRTRWALLPTLSLAGLALLSGCVVAPASPYGQMQGQVYGQPEYVDVPPPAPVYEQVGPPPVLGHVWVSGYWRWHLGRHVWIGGRWAAPPRGGVRWAPHRWDRHGRGWRLNPGHWR
jgi:WXXGXW repeat (2 copies)